MAADWGRIRAEFPALADWTYLNTATFGQVPRRAVEAVRGHFERRDAQACSDFMSWFEDADRIRGLAARLIHCAPADIAYIPNASTALSLLLGGVPWKPGDQVLTLTDEFPNHYYYPSQLGGQGVEFVEVPWERFYEAVNPRTRLVAFSTVNYSTGFRPPLEEIADHLRPRGILLYLDGTQSLGALPFDAARIRPSVFAVHAYKWLLSPNGAGFMYVDPRVREWLQPAVIGWRSDRGWRDPEHLHHGLPHFKLDAEKYEGGMLAFPVLYAMGAVLEMLLEIGPPAIEQRVREIAARTRDVLRAAGAALLCDSLPHHDAPIVAARFADRDAGELAQQLAAQRVLVAARHGRLRVSPHFYNDEADLARLAEALK